MTQPSAEFLDLQAALAGEYSLQRELGRGGMGVVYLARDVQLDRDVAIKVLPAEMARDATARERFLREARMAAGLSHPHIVPIHRVGEARGFVFFVMSFVDGETLGERIRAHGPLPPADAARVLREVAWALAYAHGRGIVHRDVKPDNILLEKATGRALVTDFGIAHAGAEAAAADGGKIMGTAHFMSPEQATGDVLDGRSDIYSLGVVGYLAVSGRLPYEEKNLPALLVKQATEDPQSVTRAAPGLPPALGAAIDKCLARLPEQRFQGGEAMADALAPAPDTRRALPPSLRAWLAARNPLSAPYLAFSGVFGTLFTINTLIWALGQRPEGFKPDVWLLAGLASLPIFPIIGFHLNEARKQFKAGHSLADLRSAIDVERRERAETEAAVEEKVEPPGHRLLRNLTVASATWMGVTFLMALLNVIHENRGGLPLLLTPVGTTMLLGAISNALGVRFIPSGLRNWWRSGIRDRIWNSAIGAWFARRLGAPERSQLAGPSAFRATEAALGLAASELYGALPRDYQQQLADLPDIVRVLEARAAEARAELEIVGAMAPTGSDAAVLAARKTRAQAQLGEAVKALEGIRLDLLRVHAGASDLAPLTTLMDAARRVGEDLNRLADAQREVDASLLPPSRTT